MAEIRWNEEVEKRKEELIRDLQSLIQIKSVLDESHATSDAPLGKGVKEALEFMLKLGERDGFSSLNVGNVAGHIEFGQGDELLGILCHVDVVPEGDGWSVEPFGGEIKDGKIFGRGSIDDKGPTMAAYYAMKIVKDLGVPINKRVRMIIGTDEESDWRCVDHYFQVEEMPTFGFAPDADFPIIYAEKGIADFDIVQTAKEKDAAESEVEVLSFQSGRRYNMVPDHAKAVLMIHHGETKILQQFSDYLSENGLQGKYFMDRGDLVLEMEGISVHGSEPEKGKNAGLYLCDFLSRLDLPKYEKDFFQFVSHYFHQDFTGDSLGLAYEDDITGKLSLNAGILSFDRNRGGKIGISMRYPVTFPLKDRIDQLKNSLREKGLAIENFSDSKPHHVDKDHPFIQTLANVYEQQTGEKAELLAIGGGTYARSLDTGVAFGALFPGRPDVAHQKDEYMFLEDLWKATAIYAQAIYELTR
ncbi:dipeptidase PepV [Bacillus smithii]|uniref:dipeptidase PepV n=1 Tax=Bacillus smithii TaxID=1479 RepID=UPI002E206D0C|nr:dipeptidase PepV [Bacillus smithii]